MIIYAVDDEKLELEALEEAILEGVNDCSLSCFSSSRKLLEQAKITPPDVVFSDIEMPGIKGIDLARKLIGINPNANIIFVTGYSEYVADAMDMFASGYVMKPVDKKQIVKQMENLRHPISKEKHISVKTFGIFTVYKDKLPVNFRYAKSKELLAYLVDRKGALVSRRDLDTVLFEDGDYSRREQKLISRFVEELVKDLNAAGIEKMFLKNDGGYCVLPDEFSCDLYDYLEGHKELFHGEYMEEYFWGEDFKAEAMFDEEDYLD